MVGTGTGSHNGCHLVVVEIHPADLRSHRDAPLMDPQMPVLGGLEAARIIRNDLKMQLPIIALTAAVMKGDQQASLAAGINDFLTKPIRVKNLKETILRWTKLDILNQEGRGQTAVLLEEVVSF